MNYTINPASPGQANLRGFGYGANIGWISFENTGNPRVLFSNGRLRGVASSPNCGWISLDDLNVFVQTDTIASARALIAARGSRRLDALHRCA